MRKKSNIIVRKFIYDLAETQNSLDLNDLDEESEEAREEVDEDIHHNTADKLEVQNDHEEKE